MRSLYWQGRLNALPSSIVLFTRGMSAAFSTFELTVGWEDTFWERMVNRPASSLAGSGWETLSDEGDWALQDGQLWHTNPARQQAVIAKGPAWEAYEMVVNIRLAGRWGKWGNLRVLSGAR